MKIFVCVNDALPESIVLVADSEEKMRAMLESRLAELNLSHLHCSAHEISEEEFYLSTKSPKVKLDVS